MALFTQQMTRKCLPLVDGAGEANAEVTLLTAEGASAAAPSTHGFGRLSSRLRFTLSKLLQLGADQTSLVDTAGFELVDNLAVFPIPNGDAIGGIGSDKPWMRRMQLNLYDLIIAGSECS